MEISLVEHTVERTSSQHHRTNALCLDCRRMIEMPGRKRKTRGAWYMEVRGLEHLARQDHWGGRGTAVHSMQIHKLETMHMQRTRVLIR
jgi:hypothetical protein